MVVATRPPSRVVALTVDGLTATVSTAADTVGGLLDEAGIVVGLLDEITPPPSTELATLTEPAVSVVRVREEIETLDEPIPFGRKVVRNVEMLPNDPPRLLQAGNAGTQQVTYRIIYRDGIESERWRAGVDVIAAARDEIIMIGVGGTTASATFSGMLAYLDGGRAVLLDGSSDRSREIDMGGLPDGRIFSLSPDGAWLMVSMAAPAAREGSFGNRLMLVSTATQTEALNLGIENVLWAGWDPAAVDQPRFAYTTARTTTLPPGWEANNDLWLQVVALDGTAAAPVRLIETYPASYGWWGGNYAWSPDGSRLAYAFANEVGLVDVPATTSLAAAAQPGVDLASHRPVERFIAFDTRADWAWVPGLAWSSDGSRLLFTLHANTDAAAADPFDLRFVGPDNQGGTLRPAVGAWSAALWSPEATDRPASLVYLQATRSDSSLDSDYTMWIAGADGSDARRLFPAEGEVSLFPRTPQSIAWSPDARQLAFVFDGTLHILNPDTGDYFRAGGDDAPDSLLTWAPYGAATAMP